jgi:hypothetical protein
MDRRSNHFLGLPGVAVVLFFMLHAPHCNYLLPDLNCGFVHKGIKNHSLLGIGPETRSPVGASRVAAPHTEFYPRIPNQIAFIVTNVFQ